MRFNKREKVCWLSNNFLFQQLNLILNINPYLGLQKVWQTKRARIHLLRRPVTLSSSILSSQIIHLAFFPHFPLFSFLVPSSQASLLLIARIRVHSLAERMTESFPHMHERKLSSGTMLLIRITLKLLFL